MASTKSVYFVIRIWSLKEVKNSLTASRCHLKAYPRCGQPTSKVSILKMKQQQHDINLRRTRKKKIRVPDGISEPTTLRDLVGCSNHLSYWRLYGEQGPICGSRLEPHHAATQPSNDRHTRSEELTNSIALSRWNNNNTIESPVAQVVRASD